MQKTILKLKIFLILLFIKSLTLSAQDSVKTIAGSLQGYTNGSASIARFNYPYDVWGDTLGNLFVTDTKNQRVRKISGGSQRIVSTIAGNGSSGFKDDTASAAIFNDLKGICGDKSGNLYITDSWNHRVRKISPNGTVTTLAGTGSSSVLNEPIGICIDKSNTYLYVADFGNHRIVRIDMSGNITTLAGSGTAGYRNGTGTAARFNYPTGITIDDNNNLFVADFGNHRIRRISNAGAVTTVAGSGSSGFKNDYDSSAQFSSPHSIKIYDSLLFVSDRGNNLIRIINIRTKLASTYAGSGTAGFLDGPPFSARFNNIQGLFIDKQGNIFIADPLNNRIRTVKTSKYINANFSWKNFCQNSFTEFFDSSYKKPTSWKWNFGDPNSGTSDTSSLKNPKHKFTKAGTFYVKLVSIKDTGNISLKDSIIKIVTIYPIPSGKISKDTTVCLGDSVKLNFSGTNASSYHWSPGNMLSDSTSASPWAYSAQTTKFRLKVYNAAGCFIEDSVTVTIDTTSSKCKSFSKVSGVINKYASVTSIDTCMNSLTVDSSAGFAKGDKILIIQMKGAVIDSSNSSTFGNIINIKAAGKHEYAIIDSIGGGKFYLKNIIINKYDPASIVQAVRIPQYANLYVTSKLTARPWNGVKGGILALEASGTVILYNDIDVSGQGFTGGPSTSNGYNCGSTSYFYAASDNKGGRKGEGIVVYKTKWAKGRGAFTNGGGGGNDHNSGGAGGGNFGQGGKGGHEWSQCSSTPAQVGGLGGISLKSSFSDNRIFLGGGGGEGHQNQGNGTKGVSGGGIVLIKAGNIFSQGKSIIANGASQNTQTSDDGAGGGGAGGTIFLEIQRITSSLKVDAKGGNGGSVNYAGCVGTGGGGGGGAILTSLQSKPSILLMNTSGGAPGKITNSGSSCYNTSYGADTGKTGGIINGLNVPESNKPFSRPKTKVSGSNIACIGDSVKLTASGGIAYLWLPGNSIKDSTDASVWVKPVKTSTYKVKIFYSPNCYKLDSFTVMLNNPPLLDPPALRCVSIENDTTIKLIWSPTKDSAYFSKYRIYRNNNGNQVFNSIDSIYNRLTSSYTNVNLSNTDSIPYTYQLSSLNICDKEGTKSNQLSSIILKFNKYSEKHLVLAWNSPASSFKGKYYLEVDSGNGFKFLDTTSKLSFNFSKCSFIGRFRIYTIDSSSSCKSYSNITKTGILKDVTKPAMPKILNATVKSWSSVAVTFTKSDSNDVKNYLVFRADNNGAYKLIQTISKSGNTATYLISDNNVSADKNNYCYKIIAQDSCGNLSDSSAAHCPVNLAGMAGNLKSELSWTPYKGFSTDTVEVQRFANGNWRTLAKLTDNSTTYTDALGINCNFDYFYRIKSREAAGNKQESYSDTIKVSPFDTISPAQVNILSATVTSRSSIQINFSKVNDKDVNRYDIYVSKNGSSFSKLTTVFRPGTSTITYLHSGITPMNDNYCYRVFALDSCSNNISKTTETHCAVQLTGTALNKSAILNWSKYKGFAVKNYLVERFENNSWKLIKSLNPADTSYFDANLPCNIKQFYRIRSTENGGDQAQSLSDTITLTPFDTIPPANVNISRVTVVNGTSIQITFNQVYDPDVAYYEVYSKKNNGSFVKIGTVNYQPVYQYNYLHTAIDALQDTFCYQVKAFDTCSNTLSKTSGTHCAVQLKGTTGNLKNNLSWSEYKGFGDAGYIIQKFNNGNWISIDTVYTNITKYTDTLVSCNVAGTYRIKAYQLSWTSMTSLSDTITLTPFDTIKPATPTIKFVTVENDKNIKIEWNKSSSTDVKNYIIYRQNGSNYFAIDTVENLNLYTDTNVNVFAQSYCYRVQAMDSCADNLSLVSPPHCTMNLKASISGCEKAISLSWNKYSGWNNISAIDIYRKENNGIPALLSTISGNAVSFKDSGLNYHNNYCYYIIAKESGGSIVSQSNADCKQTFFIDTPKVISASKISTSATNGNIVIKWKSMKGKPHLSHYKLYYSKSGSGIFSVLNNNIPVSQDSFVHSNIDTRNGEHYYYLEVIDSCGSVSDVSSTHKTMDLEVSIGQLIHNLNWTAYKGFVLKHYLIQRLEQGGFKTIDTIPATDTASRQFPAPCNYNLQYRIAAISLEDNISYSDTMGRIAIDTIPSNPANIQNLTVLNGNSTRLNFKGADSLDVYAYGIQRANNGNWSTAGQVLFTSPGDQYEFNDNINTLNDRICYTVLTMDSCLNITPTDTFCAVQLAGDPKNLANLLAWSSFKGYPVGKYSLVSFNGSSWDTIVNLNANDTGFLHLPLNCNVPRTYKVIGFELNGNRETMSDSITLTPFDTLAPPVPGTNYSTVLNGSSIYFSWQASVPDVKQYELAMKTANGTWQVMDTLYLQTDYTFTGLNSLDSSYCFRVVAIDSCAENRSPKSIIHCPVQLDGQPGNLSNKLKWSAYEGFTVNNYYIHKWSNGWQIIDSVDASVLTFTDTPLACNVQQFYRISAHDVNGTFISHSDSITLTPFDTIKPDAPIINYVTVLADHSIKLSWDWDTSKDVKYFEIWKQENLQAFSKLATVSYDSVYIDNAVSPQTNSYAYFIIAVDSCNVLNRSTPSDTDRIINLTLATGACAPEVRIDWTAYTDLTGGTTAYDIYRSENGSGFSVITSVPSSVLNFKDTLVTEGNSYCYKIMAKGSSTLFTSFSDSLCIMPWQFPAPDTAVMTLSTVTKTGISDGEIQLEWQPYTPADTFARGYNIYYAAGSPNAAYTLLHKENDLSKTNFTHSGINTSTQENYYLIKVFNLCDVEGESKITHSPVNLNVQNLNLEAQLSWTKYKGFDSVKSYLLQRAEDGNPFAFIASLNSADTAYHDTTVRCGHHYAYRLVTDEWNGFSKTSFSDTVAMVAYDTIPPATPVMQVASVYITGSGNGEITFSFQAATEKNRSGYKIYRSDDGITFNIIDTVFDISTGIISYTDVSLKTADLAYSYFATSIDSCVEIGGKESATSDTHTVIHLQLTAKSHVNELQWSAYKGWDNWKYVVERKTSSTAWIALDTLANTGLTYYDNKVKCDTFYTYRILGIDINSKYFTYSNTAGITAFETDSPQAPVMKRVTVNKTGTIDGEVQIEWNASASNDVANYTLYKTEADNNNWQTVASNIPFNKLSYQEPGLNTLENPYRYRLISIDSCGNTSTVFSDEHQTVLLKAIAGNEKIELNWTAYEGWPVQNYEIYKDGILLTTLPGADLSYTDVEVICPNVYSYKIKAVSAANAAINSESNVDEIAPFDNNAPAAPYLRKASVTVQNKEVFIEWNPSVSKDAAKYELYRTKFGNGGGHELIFSSSNLQQTSFTDKFDTIGEVYFYTLKTVDYCGNTGEFSNLGTVMITNGKAQSLWNELRWNPYTQWPANVAYYNIYRKTDSINYTYIGRTQKAETIFADHNLTEDSRDYCYKVEAIENGGFNEKSMSTEVCLKQEPIIWIPNAFTPQTSTNLNDMFGPKGMFIKNYEIQVINRWGEIIYTNNNGQPWDGKIAGNYVQEGVYMYMIKVYSYTNKNYFFKGTFTILR